MTYYVENHADGYALVTKAGNSIAQGDSHNMGTLYVSKRKVAQLYADTLNMFSLAIDKKLLKFTLEGGWLTVEYQENASFTPSVDGTKWSLMCAQDINEYKTAQELTNRVTIMLAENLRSARQDVNGLIVDYRKKGKL